MTIVAPTPGAIEEAVKLLRRGELVALPTETVYGLGADALDPEAVKRVFAAKGRPANHPLIVHLPDAGQLTRWASRVPREALELARDLWPGPLTLILPRGPIVPDAVTGGQDTVGLRVPGHPVALAVLRAFDSGIAAPSANRFGRISPTTARHVDEELGERVAMILDGGACDVGIESTILDLSGVAPRILRPGAISAERIAAAIGRMPQRVTSMSTGSGDDTPRVPGSLAAHYAPATPLVLVDGARLEEEVRRRAGGGERVAVFARGDRGGGTPAHAWLTAPGPAEAYAHDLYAALRTLDASGADAILIETPPGTPEWAAIHDRLDRAAAGSGTEP
jgi:L-threonylcarbamoyladenylate synthase